MITAIVYPRDEVSGGNDLDNPKKIDVSDLIDVDEFVSKIMSKRGSSVVCLTPKNRLSFDWLYGSMRDIGLELSAFETFKQRAIEAVGERDDYNYSIALVEAYIDNDSVYTKVKKKIKPLLMKIRKRIPKGYICPQ